VKELGPGKCIRQMAEAASAAFDVRIFSVGYRGV